MEKGDLTRFERCMGVLQKRLPRALINLSLIPWLITYGSVDPTTSDCPPEQTFVTTSQDEDPEHATDFRISTLNMAHGKGGTESIARAILRQEVDIIALQEATESSVKDVLDQLEDDGVYYHAAAGWNKRAYGGTYGNVILSRHPILSSINYPLRQPGDYEPRGLLVSQIMLGGVDELPLTFGATHLTPNEPGVFGKSNYAVRTAQATEVRNIMTWYGGAGGNVVLAGDLNTPPKNDAHLVLNETLKDASAGSSERPVTHPFSGDQLDHVLFTGDLQVEKAKVWGAGSDHCGMTVFMTRSEHRTKSPGVN